ncbi:hypothetical protein B1R32_12624 [Abditibacterium utsteinense]|uniref:Uncharacterized protein n=1 Tax=Abditibacterium utsteinense TaxID=1960156 RepID=A0A2S8SPC1_9BACT|nr:hypothetical protein [Abditibacterium utsteinense]PQV62640.1 hypothetical protein B1R32_12624 [Abditibacterium utsteinense]
MPLISFFVRRFITGAVARRATVFLERRFKMSPGVANIAFVVLTEVLARATEKPMSAASKKVGGRFGRRG